MAKCMSQQGKIRQIPGISCGNYGHGQNSTWPGIIFPYGIRNRHHIFLQTGSIIGKQLSDWKDFLPGFCFHSITVPFPVPGTGNLTILAAQHAVPELFPYPDRHDSRRHHVGAQTAPDLHYTVFRYGIHGAGPDAQPAIPAITQLPRVNIIGRKDCIRKKDMQGHKRPGLMIVDQSVSAIFSKTSAIGNFLHRQRRIDFYLISVFLKNGSQVLHGFSCFRIGGIVCAVIPFARGKRILIHSIGTGSRNNRPRIRQYRPGVLGKSSFLPVTGCVRIKKFAYLNSLFPKRERPDRQKRNGIQSQFLRPLPDDFLSVCLIQFLSLPGDYCRTLSE